MLTKENYEKTINSYTKSDWEPLFELVPEIEKTTNFGEFRDGNKIGCNTTTMPYWEYSEIVQKFIKAVYDIPIIISFDWMSWEEGQQILKDDEFDYDTIDTPTKCKLITVIVRNDRFNDGYLIWAFRTNRINKLLQSLKKDKTR